MFCSNVNVSHQQFIVKRLLTAWRNSTHGGNWRAPSSPRCWQHGTFPVSSLPPCVPNPIFIELLSRNKLSGQAKASSRRRRSHRTRSPRSRRYQNRHPTTLMKTMVSDWGDRRSSRWRNSWSRPSTAETSPDTREWLWGFVLNFSEWFALSVRFVIHIWLLLSQNRWATWWREWTSTNFTLKTVRNEKILQVFVDSRVGNFHSFGQKLSGHQHYDPEPARSSARWRYSVHCIRSIDTICRQVS